MTSATRKLRVAVKLDLHRSYRASKMKHLKHEIFPRGQPLHSPWNPTLVHITVQSTCGVVSKAAVPVTTFHVPKVQLDANGWSTIFNALLKVVKQNGITDWIPVYGSVNPVYYTEYSIKILTLASHCKTIARTQLLWKKYDGKCECQTRDWAQKIGRHNAIINN